MKTTKKLIIIMCGYVLSSLLIFYVRLYNPEGRAMSVSLISVSTMLEQCLAPSRHSINIK